MRFLKLNYNDGRTIVLCLDDISRIEDGGNSLTIIYLRYSIEEPYAFQKDIDDFLAAAFSDNSGGEYELIDIDEREEPNDDFSLSDLMKSA